MRFTDIAENADDGIRINFDAFGEGTPLLMLHGSALSRAPWRGLGYVRALRDEYRVITPDLRGHGKSDKPHEALAYSLDAFLGDVEAVLDRAGVERAHLVGYSFGARIGLQLAVEHSPRLLSVTQLGGSPAPVAGVLEKVFFPGVVEVLRQGTMDDFVEGWEHRRGRPLDAATAGAMRSNDPQALAAYFEGIAQKTGNTDEELKSIRVPMLWMAGTLDHPRYEESQDAAEVMGSPFVSLPDRTHSSTLFPSKAVTDVLRLFLHDADRRAGIGR